MGRCGGKNDDALVGVCVTCPRAQRDRAVYYFRNALARLKEQHGDAIAIPDDKFKVGMVLPRMTALVLRCFARVPVSSAEEHANTATTLHMFLTHLARLDYGLLHLNLGFRLQDVGAHVVSLQHIQEVLALQVGGCLGRSVKYCWRGGPVRLTVCTVRFAAVRDVDQAVRHHLPAPCAR